MNPERLLQYFERISEVEDAVPRLRRFILDLAVRGKLVEQDPADEPAEEPLRFVHNNIASHTDPAGWIKGQFGSLLDMRYGKGLPAKERKEQGKVPVFGSNGIVGFTDTALTDKPSIIIGRKGSAGALNLCNGPSWTTDVAYFLIPPDYFDIRFLLFALETLDLGSLGKGVKPGLSRSDAYQLSIDVPPLAEQHRIVAKVDELMALCDDLEAAQAKRETRRDRLVAATLHGLDNGEVTFEESARFYFRHLPRLTTRPEHIQQLRQTILNLAVRGKLVEQDPEDEPASELLKRIESEKQRLVTEKKNKRQSTLIPVDEAESPFVAPKGWSLVPFGGVFVDIFTGPFGTALKATEYIHGATPVINPQNMKDGMIVPTDETCVGPETIGRLSSFVVYERDVIVARRGEMGRCAVVSHRENGWLCGTGSLVLRPPKEVVPQYVTLFLRSPSTVIRLADDSVGSTMSNLNQRIMINLPFGLPPLAEQHRIVAKVDKLMALCNELETQLTTTATTRRQLLEATLHEALAVGA